MGAPIRGGRDETDACRGGHQLSARWLTVREVAAPRGVARPRQRRGDRLVGPGRSGDDAQLFRLGVIDSFETPLGTWTVHELGEDQFVHYLAMVRSEGLVFQVVGGAPADPGPSIELAQSMEVTRRA
jgi:hypothetical protein